MHDDADSAYHGHDDKVVCRCRHWHLRWKWINNMVYRLMSYFLLHICTTT
jgi:hypothetical protein